VRGREGKRGDVMLSTVLLDVAWRGWQTTRSQVADRTRELDACVLRVGSECEARFVHELDGSRFVPWRARQLNERGNSPRLCNLRLNTLRVFLDYCVSMGYADTNPLRGLKLLPDRGTCLTRALTLPETKALLASSEASYRAMWAGYLVTGMRHRELTLTTWGDVDLDAGLLWLAQGRTKTRTGRFCCLPTRLASLLRGRRGDPWYPENPVWPNADGGFFRNNLLKRLRSHLDRAGIPWRVKRDCRSTDPTVDIQSLRITFGTLLANVVGAPEAIVSSMMGHGKTRSGSVFLRKYNKPDPSQLIPWAQKLEDVILA
jgi:integrase